MIGKVLGIRKSKPTARLLARKLCVPYGENINRSEGKFDFIFRYGNTEQFDNPVKMIFNKGHDIILVSNKLKMRRKLIESNIPVPKLYNLDAIEESRYEIDSKELPLIARPVNHWKGKDFNLVFSYDEAITYLRKGYYLQGVINKETEYRIFVWQGGVFECSIKEPRLERYNMLVRNFGNGWRFGYKQRLETPQELRKYARESVELAGLDFGAVDCCVDKKGDYYIFEINSAPSLIERKAEKLANKITKYMEENFIERYSPHACGEADDSEPPDEDIDPADVDESDSHSHRSEIETRRERDEAEFQRRIRNLYFREQ